MIIIVPDMISYHMRPEDAWALPYPDFIWLSDNTIERLKERK